MQNSKTPYAEELSDYFTNRGFYIVRDKDFDRYLDVMTDSFINYPLMRYVTGGYDYDKIKLFQWSSIKGMDYNSITISDSQDINGILCFYRPNTEPNPMSYVKNGGYKFFWKFGFFRTWRSIFCMINMGKIMKKYIKPNDIYLYFLATDPKQQGKGIGHKLVQAVVDYCSEKGCGAYLETYESNNIEFYKKCGFELMETVDIKSDFEFKLYSFYMKAK